MKRWTGPREKKEEEEKVFAHFLFLQILDDLADTAVLTTPQKHIGRLIASGRARRA